MSRSVLVSGLGFMGGSLAAALCQAGWQVFLHHRRQEVIDDAVARGYGRSYVDIPKMADIDVVVLGVPVDCVPEQAASWMAQGAQTVTDMGSTKAAICDALRAHGSQFVGSHPMCGSHLQGLAHAQPHLFQGATCVVTPTTAATTQLEIITELWQTVGCRVMRLSPDQHDELVMQASHLPHVLSALTAQLLSDEALPLAATGFADTSRVAAGSAPLWTEILTSNSNALKTGLAQAQRHLQDLQQKLEAGDKQAVHDWLQQAQEKRLRFDAKSPDAH